MPIISHVGSRSWKVRALYGVLVAVLLIGSVTMIYPLLVMLSGSVKSDTDYNDVSTYPKYWFDDLTLFQKYAESKYNGSTDQLEIQWQRSVSAWDKIEAPAENSSVLDDFLEWRKQARHWWLGHSNSSDILLINARLFRARMQAKYNDDIDAFRNAMHLTLKSWNDVRPPLSPNPFRFIDHERPIAREFQEFALTRPIEDRNIPNLDGTFIRTFLMTAYTDDIGTYNRTHGSNHKTWDEIFLQRRAPASGLEREDWKKFVRERLTLECIRIDPSATDAYRDFIAARYEDIGQYNTKFNAHFGSFRDLPLPSSAPETTLEQVDWASFIGDSKACPAEFLEVYGPRQSFEEFVARRRSVPVESLVPLLLPIYEADYHDTLAHTSDLRWEFSTRNYKHVLEFILMHGRGVWNTLIYCLLAIGTSLIVNPLAAYSLSRFKPPSTYTVLLFCMATMAFPGEVTMIPGFLLKRNFPLWSLIGGSAAFFTTWIVLGRIKNDIRDTARALWSLPVALAVGIWAVPAVAGDVHISLLNTFAALVLPSMANGFSIFLLKGFFDSLPQELYEAAEIDGASEWTKFWTFTMSLSKPILAVTALEAFNGAYSAFMMALIVIPDQKMWTLMVWLYQLQNRVHPSVVYAALVISAIPTLLVFVFCQNLIMRGIVVPTEK